MHKFPRDSVALFVDNVRVCVKSLYLFFCHLALRDIRMMMMMMWCVNFTFILFSSIDDQMLFSHWQSMSFISHRHFCQIGISKKCASMIIAENDDNDMKRKEAEQRENERKSSMHNWVNRYASFLFSVIHRRQLWECLSIWSIERDRYRANSTYNSHRTRIVSSFSYA